MRAAAPDTVVATFKVDGAEQKITYGELNERIDAPLADLEKQKHQLRKRGLEGYVIEKLVQAEAKKRGMTNEEQLLKAEVEDKVPAAVRRGDQEALRPGQGQRPAAPGRDAGAGEAARSSTSSREQPSSEKAQALFDELKQGRQRADHLPEPAEERKQVEATGPSKGPENAPITIVEFSDFQCPFCSRANDTVDEVMKEYADKVRLVFRHFPLDFHKKAPKAAEASLCAADHC